MPQLTAYNTASHGRGIRPAGAPFASRSPIFASNAMAATSHPLATQIAVDILKAGGSAVDAAIGANAALGVMEPTGCGIGGDLFAIVWDPQRRRLLGLNASGRSPRGLSRKTLIEDLTTLDSPEEIPYFGALPVSVPGAVDGWFELHRRFGRLSMAAILDPAVRYARDGFPVSPVIAHEWKEYSKELERLDLRPEPFHNLRSTFLIAGLAPGAGETFTNPDLAITYERLAADGRAVFYEGDIANTIDAYMRRIGGYLRKSDLLAHTSEWIEPVSVSYRGYDVFELPPNGQGIATLQMLNILEGFNLTGMGHNTAEYLHIHTETKKLAYADRDFYYADPDFFAAPLSWLISEEYAEVRRALISPDRVLEDVEHGEPQIEDGDTVYLTTADSSGMMVSLIQSNYHGMGSGLVPDGLGFSLQNRGRLFALDPAHPNAYEPGKRPFHTIIPAFVMKDGQPFMSFGVMGGAMQPQGHVQILCNMLDFGFNPQEAGDAARYRHVGGSRGTGEGSAGAGVLHLEEGIAGSVADELRDRGHRVEFSAGGFGGYQAIVLDAENGFYVGASEMRKDGQAAGF